MRFRHYLLALLLVTPLAALPADPELPDGTDKALKQIPTFRLPAGLKVELFAAEPMLTSPVAIGLDERNRVYVAEELRFNRGTQENRSNAALPTQFLLEDDLQSKTLDDRRKLLEKWAHKFPGGMDWYTRHSDQLRLLEDTKGRGNADKSTVLAKFSGVLDGLAAGVMATNGDVYFTCIPNLWLFKKGSDKPVSLLSGFGVNCAFLGHDLHGLCWGPDGKLYFSVGDRGFHVTTKEGTTLSGPRTGAVFRCNADGTELEVVHRGLRNPQELAFDEHGNLFADDNNCDKGDHGRLVYVVEGGESGWNMAYQTIPSPYMAGPWFAERLWHLQHPGQAAYIVPPVGEIGTGPSGFLFTSGTSLPDRYRNAFIMCNYTGNGGLESFKVKPKGAGFEIDDYHDFLKPIRATDAEFGYDGKLYVSDFVDLDWTGKSLGGRVYTVFDPKKLDDATVKETKKLFAEGFEQRDYRELAKLLGHADQRVRQRAQFALVKAATASTLEGKAAALSLQLAALKATNTVERLHAVWGLGQIAKTSPAAVKLLTNLLGDPDAEVRAQAAVKLLTNLLGDPDAEVRAQAAKVLGDGKHAGAAESLTDLLRDASPRVKFFAAQSLGKLKHKPAVGHLFALLRVNDNQDVYLRHACVQALATIGDADAVNAKAADDSPAVRLAVVLVQRKLQDKRLAQFLGDRDWHVRTEAARAIHDLPLEDLYPQLAATLPKLGETPIPDGDALVRRCINAAFRLGTADHAKAVLGVVTNPNFSLAARGEALAALADWSNPGPRDRVTGFWRPVVNRDASFLRSLVEADLANLLGKTSGQLQTDAVLLMLRTGVKADDEQFAGWVRDTKREPGARVAALRFLCLRNTPQADAILSASLTDAEPTLRAEARELLVGADPKRAAAELSRVLADPSAPLAERQRAVATLVKCKDPAAAKQLDRLAVELSQGKLPDELHIDVLDALRDAPTALRDKMRTGYEALLSRDPVGKFRTSLTGGDAARGRELFYNHTAAQCVRCHTVNGSGGTAGPDLSKVAAKYPEKLREHLLESLVLPSAKIAEGYASVTLTLSDGRTVAGVVLREDRQSLTLQTPDGQKLAVEVADIDKRTTPTSPMPSVEKTLTPREMRDLIEFLTTLK